MRQWAPLGRSPISRLLTHGLALLPLALVGLCLTACETEPIEDIYFASPELVLVRGGDTIYDVALRRAVAVEDLRRWNGLGPDEDVKPGERLLVWYLPEPDAMIAAFGDGNADPIDPDPVVASASGRSRRGTAGSGTDKPRAVVRIAAAVLEAPPTLEPEPEADPGNASGQRISIDRTKLGANRPGANLGAFSAGDVDLGEGVDNELADRVAALSTRSMERGATIGESSLAGGGTAEQFDGVVRERRAAPVKSGPTVGSGAVRAKRLAMPPARRCLGGPDASQLTGERDMLGSQGLTAAQIRSSLGGFVQHTMSCIPSGSKGTFSVVAEITVGCNGQVSDVWIVNGGGLPGNVTECIGETLKYAGFPAHALPDGLTFQYPIQFRY